MLVSIFWDCFASVHTCTRILLPWEQQTPCAARCRALRLLTDVMVLEVEYLSNAAVRERAAKSWLCAFFYIFFFRKQCLDDRRG